MWVPPEKDKYVQLLLFDLPDDKEKIDPAELPYFENPKNDNERLFNLQRKYYEGDKNALAKMYAILEKIAPRLVNIESKSRQLILPKSYMRDKGIEAVMIFVEGVLKKELVIKKSFIAYLRLQVLRVMFYHTKSHGFEKWLTENNVNLFSLDQFEAEWMREQFERDFEAERQERRENKI